MMNYSKGSIMLHRMFQRQSAVTAWVMLMLLLLLTLPLPKSLQTIQPNGHYTELCTAQGSRMVWVNEDGRADSTASMPSASQDNSNLPHHSNALMGHCPFCLISLFFLLLPALLLILAHLKSRSALNVPCHIPRSIKLILRTPPSRAPPCFLAI